MRIRLTNQYILLLKLIIHLSSLLTIIVVFYRAIYDQLGGDPVEELLHFTGIGAFNLLLISLAVTPIAKQFKQAPLLRVRRLLGLYAFFYALTHLVSFVLFELQLEWRLVISEIIDRPYITVGFAALLILFFMAITSTKGIQRKMGPTWQKLHNWVYLGALLIALHYIWSVKSNITEPLIYWVILLVMLFLRRKKLANLVKARKKPTKKLA